MAGKVILKTTIKREKGFLYYTGTDENGNLTICQTIMAHGRKVKGGKKK